jgi:hypothetical protein
MSAAGDRHGGDGVRAACGPRVGPVCVHRPPPFSSTSGVNSAVASYLVMCGANLRSVQELLEHKTGKKTVRYTHRSTPHLQETVNLLDRLCVPAPCGVEQGR